MLISIFFFFLPFSSSSSSLLHCFISKIKRENRGASMDLREVGGLNPP